MCFIPTGSRDDAQVSGCQYQLSSRAQWSSQVALVVKDPPTSAGDRRDTDPIPGSGRSPGGGHGNPLQYSCWRIPWREDPGGLWSLGSQRLERDWSDLAHIYPLHSYLSNPGDGQGACQSIYFPWYCRVRFFFRFVPDFILTQLLELNW